MSLPSNVSENDQLIYWLGKSIIAGMNFEILDCPECTLPHNDTGYWAMHPHKTHLCQNCGATFEGTEYAVSNHLFRPQKLSSVD